MFGIQKKAPVTWRSLVAIDSSLFTFHMVFHVPMFHLYDTKTLVALFIRQERGQSIPHTQRERARKKDL
jgi:hypothetical protein